MKKKRGEEEESWLAVQTFIRIACTTDLQGPEGFAFCLGALRDNGGGLGDGGVHALDQHPVACRHAVHLHFVPGLGDEQSCHLYERREKKYIF